MLADLNLGIKNLQETYSMHNTIVLIQARMGSTRLPGKVLKEVCNKSLLELMVERISIAKNIDNIAIITTEQSEDDVIVEMCKNNEWQYFRGSSHNLLDRHYKAALHFGADHVIKIPSDCPLVDPSVIDKVVNFYFTSQVDYASNLHPQSYPDGNDVEIMSVTTLERAMNLASKDFELEHTTPYIWNRPSEFRLGNYLMNELEDLSNVYRYTLDYIEDFFVIKKIFESLYEDEKIFTVDAIIQFLYTNKEVQDINKKHIGVNWYKPYLNELNLKKL